MVRIKLFLRRLKEASYKRAMMYIDRVHNESKKPRLLIALDALFCSVVYNVGFYDYYIFGFAHIHGYKKRSSFFTMKDNWRLNKLVNKEGQDKYFRQKDLFYETFNDSLGRKWLNLNKISFEEFCEFVAEFPVFFTKKIRSFGGLGVKKVDSQGKDLLKLYDSLKEEGFGLIEEPLTQHPKINELNPSSINTIRVATLVDDEGIPHVMFTFIRTGVKGSYVDNSTSGGLNVLINKNGVITKPAMRDKTGEMFSEHPDTHVSFIGFEIPFFKEAIELCKKKASVVEGIRYVGWDVCITPNGPVFVEGNYLPAYDGQMYYQLDEPGYGLKPLYKKYVKDF